MVDEQAVERHYDRSGIATAIFAALSAAGKNLDRLSQDDLAPLDEFHVRGREATVELARGLELRRGQRVLDVGSGIGGPSRYVSATFGCRVTGLDLTAAYCEAASELARRIGLAGQVDYHHGSALAMPFADAAFDAAFSQHVAMNIADKAALYREVWRVLAPGARFGIYDQLAGSGGEILYPVPWAGTPAISFVVPPADLRTLLEATGFEIVSWCERAAEGRQWADQVEARMGGPTPPPSALLLLLGAQAAPMVRNVCQNLREGRIVPTEVICRKPG